MTSLTDISKKEACSQLQLICERQGAELNQFLSEIQGRMAAKDFDVLREMVADLMGNGLYDTFVAISREFPELKPTWIVAAR